MLQPTIAPSQCSTILGWQFSFFQELQVPTSHFSGIQTWSTYEILNGLRGHQVGFKIRLEVKCVFACAGLVHQNLLFL